MQTFQKETFKRIKKCFGDINVNEVISMYKKLQFHNHQNLGHVSLTRPLQKDYDTESTWIEIPGEYCGYIPEAPLCQIKEENLF